MNPPDDTDVAERPTHVTIAGWLFVLGGVALVIFAILNAVEGVGFLNAAGSTTGLASAINQGVGEALMQFAVMLLVISILPIVTGVFVLRRKRWARIVAFVLAVLAVVGGALATLAGLRAPEGPDLVRMVVGPVVALASVYVLWALATNGEAFRRTTSQQART